MMEKSKHAGAALIVTAGIFWASMGIFVRSLGKYGFDSMQISALRLLSASACFWLVLALRRRSGFKIQRRDIPLFLGMGLGSVAVMTCSYFTAIRLLTMSTAAILLYTSPIWVMIMSVLFFREKITVRKIIALAFAFGGCVMVSGLGSTQINVPGLIAGLLSGVAYGLYSIFGTVALRRYSPFTVTAYAFSIGGMGVLALADPPDMIQKIAAAENIPGLLLLVAATGIVTAVIPYLLYTIGLKSTEPSRAAILATSEPMVATLLGVIVYREGLNPVCCAGILCILLAIITLNSAKANT